MSKLPQNSYENIDQSRKISLIAYAFSVFSLIIFMHTFLFSNEKELKQQAIYWFYTSLVSALIPNIKQFKIKDFEVQFKEEIIKEISSKIDQQTEKIDSKFNSIFDQIKKHEDSLSEEYKKVRDTINDKFASRLEKISPEEKFQAQEKHSIKHLKKFNISLIQVKQLFNKIGFYQGSMNEEFNQELADAIIKFQTDYEITPFDGICGMKTLSKLREFVNLKNTFQ